MDTPWRLLTLRFLFRPPNDEKAAQVMRESMFETDGCGPGGSAEECYWPSDRVGWQAGSQATRHDYPQALKRTHMSAGIALNVIRELQQRLAANENAPLSELHEILRMCLVPGNLLW